MTIEVRTTASGNPGTGGWNAILPDPGPAKAVDGAVDADWLVVGAGFAGLAAARRLTLTRPGDRVVVLEALRVGEGPAGRSSGFMIDLPHDLGSSDYAGGVDADRAQTAMNRRALSFASEAAEDFAMGRSTFDPRGKINVAATGSGERHNRAYRQHLEAMGESADWLDETEVRDIFGTDYYRSGLFTPGTIMIQPAAFLREMAAGIGRTAELHEASPVTSMRRVGSAWVATTPGGSVRSPVVILAVNGHLESFGFLRRRLMHVFLYASMTTPLDADALRRLGGHDQWGAVPADPMGSTIRRFEAPDGFRIVVRNVFRWSGIEASRRSVDSAAEHHDRAFRRRFGFDPQIQHRWGGRLCMTFNGAPAVGMIDDGLVSACAQNGLGASKGTLHGMVAADIATGSDNPDIEAVLAAGRPSRVPPEPFATIGATAYLRFREWRAGAER